MDITHVFLFCFVFFFLSYGCCDQTESWKDYTFIDSTQSFYKLHKTNSSWSEANRTCAEEEALIFYPDSAHELLLIKKWWKDCKTGPCLDNEFILVGYTDAEKRGDFKTIDGIPVNEVYNVWYPGEPNNRDFDNKIAEDCMELYTNTLELNDIVCDSNSDRTRHPFVCKKKLSTINGQLDKSWKDYTYIDYSQSFYKFYKKQVSWIAANKTCTSDGAFLFYPESYHEINLVKEWWEKCTLGPKCLNNDYVHMGYSDLKMKGGFVSVDGVDLRENCFSHGQLYVACSRVSSRSSLVTLAPQGIKIEQVFHNWQENEPNLQDGEDCVELSGKNLNLNDIPCEGDSDRVKHSFICKKKLSTVHWNPENNKINKRFDSGVIISLPENINQPGEITDTSPPEENRASQLSYSILLLVLISIIL